MIKSYNYIVIDSDTISNFIVKITIERYLNPSDIHIFSNPSEGLEYMKNANMKDTHTIVFLNIHIPFLSGWKFLSEFENFAPDMQNLFTIFILTASIDKQDFVRAKNIKSVGGFLVKPLKKEIIIALINELEWKVKHLSKSKHRQR